MSASSLPTEYFDDVYAADPDPWKFETSEYERAKYATTMAALPEARYRSGFEIGCSIGVLTEQLSRRCDRLLAVDVSDSALAKARARCVDAPNVDFAAMRVPDELPSRRFDLIMVSEVAYYWSLPDLARASTWMTDHLEPGGSLVLVHWTPPVADYPLGGDEVHEHFLELARRGRLRHVNGERHDRYRLDTFTTP